LVSKPYAKLRGLNVPRVLLGTSPFIAAGQFGLRAWDYHRKFVGKSEKVAEIIEHCIGLGVKGIQVLAYDYIVEAVKMAMEETGEDIFVVGTVMPENPRKSLKLLEMINCRIALVHGALTSPRHAKAVGKQLKLIEEMEMIPGIALHDALFLESMLKIYPEIEVVMAPVNVEGIFMQDREKSLKMLEESDRFIIAKKVLAAGRIKPERAFNYVFSLPFIDAVAVGVASKEEADETFTAAWKALRARAGTSRDLSGTA